MSGVTKNQPTTKQWSVHSLQNWTQGTREQDLQAAGPAAKPCISLPAKTALNKWADHPGK